MMRLSHARGRHLQSTAGYRAEGSDAGHTATPVVAPQVGPRLPVISCRVCSVVVLGRGQFKDPIKRLWPDQWAQRNTRPHHDTWVNWPPINMAAPELRINAMSRSVASAWTATGA